MRAFFRTYMTQERQKEVSTTGFPPTAYSVSRITKTHFLERIEDTHFNLLNFLGLFDSLDNLFNFIRRHGIWFYTFKRLTLTLRPFRRFLE